MSLISLHHSAVLAEQVRELLLFIGDVDLWRHTSVLVTAFFALEGLVNVDDISVPRRGFMGGGVVECVGGYGTLDWASTFDFFDFW